MLTLERGSAWQVISAAVAKVQCLVRGCLVNPPFFVKDLSLILKTNEYVTRDLRFSSKVLALSLLGLQYIPLVLLSRPELSGRFSSLGGFCLLAKD